MLIKNVTFSVKYELELLVSIHTADIPFKPNLEFEIALITPSGVPGVFDEHVVQASGFVMAVTDSEYAMIYLVKKAKVFN